LDKRGSVIIPFFQSKETEIQKIKTNKEKIALVLYLVKCLEGAEVVEGGVDLTPGLCLTPQPMVCSMLSGSYYRCTGRDCIGAESQEGEDLRYINGGRCVHIVNKYKPKTWIIITTVITLHFTNVTFT
jgi:hypothetical protein